MLQAAFRRHAVEIPEGVGGGLQINLHGHSVFCTFARNYGEVLCDAATAALPAACAAPCSTAG